MGLKTVYLTIDDSPSKDFRKKVDYLHNKKIPAIFFCTGKNIEERKIDVAYAMKKGFIIGNHSYSHIRFSELSLKDCYEEIDKTDELIDSIYKKAKVKRPTKIFRFPYGNKGGNVFSSKRKKIQKYLRKQKYEKPAFSKIVPGEDVDIYWTYGFEEYRMPAKDTIKDSEKIFNSNSSEIILLHDHDRTLKEFFEIVDFLISKNVKFGDFK